MCSHAPRPGVHATSYQVSPFKTTLTPLKIWKMKPFKIKHLSLRQSFLTEALQVSE